MSGCFSSVASVFARQSFPLEPAGRKQEPSSHSESFDEGAFLPITVSPNPEATGATMNRKAVEEEEAYPTPSVHRGLLKIPDYTEC
jgi:hypothetical protein